MGSGEHREGYSLASLRRDIAEGWGWEIGKDQERVGKTLVWREIRRQGLCSSVKRRMKGGMTEGYRTDFSWKVV